MYYYFLPQKGVWLVSFSGPKRSLGRRDSADCKQRGRSEAPKALSESHRSLHQENPAAVSDILDNHEEICFSGLSRFSGHVR